jgi:hypothetical protein
MNRKNESVEHGGCERFCVPRSSFVALGPNFNRVGQIISIGVDGLEFIHTPATDLSNKLFEIDIFMSGSDFYMEKVPCETVSDLKTYESPMGSLRQCVVQFGDLTHDQASQLEFLVQNYSTGRA